MTDDTTLEAGPDEFEPEFSRPIPVTRIDRQEMALTIEASETERRNLAKRFDLVALERLVAEIRLRRSPAGDRIEVRGWFQADIVQNCVIRLEPFESRVSEDFSVDFAEFEAEPAGAIDLSAEEDAPEPLTGPDIDIGELTAQFLSLSLDPHPRSPGATLEPLWQADEDPQSSPFSELRKLRPPM